MEKFNYSPINYGLSTIEDIAKRYNVKTSAMNMRIRKIQKKFRELLLANYKELLKDYGYVENKSK